MENRETMLVVSEPCLCSNQRKAKSSRETVTKGRNLVTYARSCNEISILKKEGITQFLNAKRQLERDCEGVIVQ